MGNPLERELTRVASDLRAGLVSRAALLRDYGVVIDGSDRIDIEASRRERGRRLRSAAAADDPPHIEQTILR
jgi:hypothetical protein